MSLHLPEATTPTDTPTVFTHPQFGTVRTVEIDNEVWFVGKDVAEALGYSDPRSAISKKIENEDRGVAKMATPSGTQQMTINQRTPSLLSHPQQQTPSAKEFKHWLTARSMKGQGIIVKEEEILSSRNSNDNINPLME